MVVENDPDGEERRRTLRSVIAANRFMTLATADESGTPWVTPVWFASPDGRRFLWVSLPTTRHSRNIAARPDVAIVIYDSQTTPRIARLCTSRPQLARWRMTGSTRA